MGARGWRASTVAEALGDACAGMAAARGEGAQEQGIRRAKGVDRLGPPTVQKVCSVGEQGVGEQGVGEARKEG